MTMRTRRVYSKYSAKKQQYNGHTYHSKLEAGYAQELDLRKKGKDIQDWRGQEKIDMRVNDIHICNYYIDFVIEHNDGTEEYVEVKGFDTAVWKLKWKLFEALYPDTIKTIVR